MNCKIKLYLLILFEILISISCNENKNDIKVAVAANFAKTMQEIVDSFKVHVNNIDIKIIKGSSGKLAGQILSGAEFDIFLSADFTKPMALYEKGFTDNEPIAYAFGSLALFTKNNIQLTSDLISLNNESIKHIAIANPKLAPYGKAAIEAIKNSGIDIDTSKFVYGENVIQTYQHVDLVADVGFVSKSLIIQNGSSEKYVEGKHWIEIDTSLYSPIKQGMIIISEKRPEATELFNYIQSEKAKKIIVKSGYTL